jgi:hypothetical protein
MLYTLFALEALVLASLMQVPPAAAHPHHMVWHLLASPLACSSASCLQPILIAAQAHHLVWHVHSQPLAACCQQVLSVRDAAIGVSLTTRG